MAATLPGDQDLIRERQNRLLEDQQRRLEQLKELPGKEARPEAPAAPVDSRCFPIQTIELQGAEHLPVTQRERLLKPYTNQCLSVSQLQQRLAQRPHRLLHRQRPGHQPRLLAPARYVQGASASAGGGRQTRRPKGR